MKAAPSIRISSFDHSGSGAAETLRPGQSCGRRHRWAARCRTGAAWPHTRGCWPPTPQRHVAEAALEGAGRASLRLVQVTMVASRSRTYQPVAPAAHRDPGEAADAGPAGSTPRGVSRRGRARPAPRPGRRSPPACGAGCCPRPAGGTNRQWCWSCSASRTLSRRARSRRRAGPAPRPIRQPGRRPGQRAVRAGQPDRSATFRSSTTRVPQFCSARTAAACPAGNLHLLGVSSRDVLI